MTLENNHFDRAGKGLGQNLHNEPAKDKPPQTETCQMTGFVGSSRDVYSLLL